MAEPAAPSREETATRAPAARTVALSLVMAASGGVLCSLARGWSAPFRLGFTLPWWALLVAVVAAEVMVFHLEVGGEAHTVTLSEMTLVIGFFFFPAHIVVLCRVLGSSVFQIVRRRQFGVKLLFNVSDFVLDAGVLVGLMHVLAVGHPLQSPVTWLGAVAAGAAAELSMMACVFTVIRWHGGRPRLANVASTALATSVMCASLGVLAADLMARSPGLLLCLAVVLVVTFGAYRGYFELNKRYAGLQLLYDFTRAVSGSVRAEAVLQEILEKARTLLQAELAEVILFDREGSLAFRQRNRESGDDTPAPSDLGVVWETVTSASTGAVLVSQASRSPMSQVLREAVGADDMIVAALRSDDGVTGAILVGNRLGNVSTFTPDDCRLFETLANHASVAIHNSHLVQQLRREAEERRHEAEVRRHQALHDALTGLPNRTNFSQRIEEVLEAGLPAAVMLMDLDRFKEVNDTLGHHHGDLLLREVAGRLAAAVREGDTAARLGGDEFALLVPDVDEGSVEEVARRVLAALSQGYLIEGIQLDVSASLGIALAPIDGADAVTLLQKADVAMYEAKTSRTVLARYSPDRDSYTPRRLALAGRLRSAIETSELLVYFQPKARLNDGAVVAVEALVRWQHPELGLVMPDEFVPIAEQTSLERPLTEFVLESALMKCAQWHRAGYRLGMAANLTVRNLLDTELPDLVGSALSRTGVSPLYLTLEVTESSVMADPDRAIAVLNRLADMGVRLSVDDFGTGYSSLSYLQRLPVHEVKVDKSFVFGMAADSNDAVIVESIVQLGHKLGLEVVAEGVEDEDAWRALRAMGCDLAQGYLLSRPVPAATLIEWLDERQTAFGAPVLAGGLA